MLTETYKTISCQENDVDLVVVIWVEIKWSVSFDTGRSCFSMVNQLKLKRGMNTLHAMLRSR